MQNSDTENLDTGVDMNCVNSYLFITADLKTLETFEEDQSRIIWRGSVKDNVQSEKPLIVQPSVIQEFRVNGFMSHEDMLKSPLIPLTFLNVFMWMSF